MPFRSFLVSVQEKNTNKIKIKRQFFITLVVIELLMNLNSKYKVLFFLKIS
jgi:hypothetical protein